MEVFRQQVQTTHFVWDGNVPLHEWVEGELQPIPVVSKGLAGQRESADFRVRQRQAQLQEHLAQGPPARGSIATPLTWWFEPESFVPMARLVGGSAEAILTDHLGTPMSMLDETGALTWSASVDTYGVVHHLRRGTRLACPFRFQGQYEDAETGLYYNRFRYYDPDGGSFISQDPIGLAGGLRIYGYVDDPTAWVDPLGLAGECGNTGANTGTGARTPAQAGISHSESKRIQNAATRTNQKITVVGSRADGTAGPGSDWDYIMSGNSAQRHSAKSSIPRGSGGGEIDRPGIDLWQDYNSDAPGYNALDTSRPHVVFEP